MSTVKVINVQHPSSASPNIVLDSSGNATMAGSMAMATPFAMRNKIINGAMEIDQRNAGASVNITGTSAYAVDRFASSFSITSGTVAQQTSTAPAGFVKSLNVTVGTAGSVVSGTICRILQAIEGFNVADLAWGTASAKTITLSFWVQSSVTGTYAGGIYNGASNRTYVFTYAISSANTWEYKTVTVAGDTTGTWATDNTVGMYVNWDLGSGSTYQAAAGSWGAGAAWSTSTSVKLSTNSSATFYLTGVQLEVGTVATPFERRIYSQELAMCQRYAYRLPSLSNSAGIIATVQSATVALAYPQNPVPMRGAPSVTFAGSWDFSITGAGVTITALAANTTDTNSIQVEATVSGQTSGQAGRIRSGYYIASSEL